MTTVDQCLASAHAALDAAVAGDIDAAAIHVMDWGETELIYGCRFWIDTLLIWAPSPARYTEPVDPSEFSPAQVWAWRLVTARIRQDTESAKALLTQTALPAAECLCALLTLVGTELGGRGEAWSAR
ncbi:hypothetical protein [Nocardia noduli]|uniref:hypothetical protein n=1 Tax=Nocardia noduli TaxID=2815722 RepID=UPI001C242FA2|nr:hypothetical protein [Nocardia noduli]